tara:strand:- start:249 stop:473 length:225 start_codon:yes stop_codon:yes gene_type:complete
MENKTGRKYDREKWGWSKLKDGKYDDEISRLDGHAYYDSPKRRKNEEAFYWFLTIAGGCIVGMVMAAMIIKLMS